MSISRFILRIAIPAMLILFTGAVATAQEFSIDYHFTGKDTPTRKNTLRLQRTFENKEKAMAYIGALPQLAMKNGYIAASVDSVVMDTESAAVYFFLGDRYIWKVNVDSVAPDILAMLNLHREPLEQRRFYYPDLQSFQSTILDHFSDNGYPFASIAVLGSTIDSNEIRLDWKIEKGVQYHIDSIRVFGNVKIRNIFLQHYLRIFNGQLYNKSTLDDIDRLLGALPFVEQQQPWDIMMLGTGATLNLYLQNKRSSEVNALIGFLPGNSITGKTKITADVRLNLKNALGSGESLLLNWQQLQPQSPRLDLEVNLPYFLNTAYGIDASFGLLKQDTTWLMLNARFGIDYVRSSRQSFQIFYQIKNSYLLRGGIDTVRIIQSRRLPQYMDVRSGSGGILYKFDNLDYKFNPRRGSQLIASVAAGIRKVTVNNEITELKDPDDPFFDFATLYDTITKKSYIATGLISANHYFPSGRRSTVKTAIEGGWIQSPQVFQNELFRVGGYKLLRGFDEESIYADRYAVATVEYRFLTGKNSYLFTFSDAALTHSVNSGGSFSNTFISGGLGIELETKVGLLNLSYAVGKRKDLKFDFKSASKIHFGYINYF